MWEVFAGFRQDGALSGCLGAADFVPQTPEMG